MASSRHKVHKPAFNGIETVLGGVVEKLSEVAIYFAQVLQQRRDEFEWFRSHSELCTKNDLAEMEDRIMKTVATKLKEATAELKKAHTDAEAVTAAVDKQNAKIAEAQALITSIGVGGAVTQALADAVTEAGKLGQVA